MRFVIRFVVVASLLAVIVPAGATPAFASGPTAGLVAQYSFEGNVDDSSGNANDGTEFGAISYAQGQCGQAAVFDGPGTGEYIQVPAQSLEDWTVTAWFQETRDTGTWQRVWDFGSVTGSQGAFFLATNNGALSSQIGVGVHQTGGANVLHLGTGIVPPVGTWHHVAVTYDKGGAGMAIYVDGVLRNIDSYNVQSFDNFSNQTWWVAKSNWAADPLFQGLIDELYIYNRVLDPTEIQALVEYECSFARDDEYSIDEDNLLTVATIDGVLSNDIDPNNNGLSAVLVSGPDNGTLSLASDGSFTYTPDLDFNGSDSFTYRANDGAEDSNVATVTITVNPVNDAPVVDLNGDDGGGIDFATLFNEGSAAVSAADSDMTLTDVDGGVVGSAVSGTGDIFVVNIDGRITRIDPTTGQQTPVGNTGASIVSARDLTIDPNTDELFVADVLSKIVKVDASSGAETVVASGGLLLRPWGITLDANGDILVADYGRAAVIRVNRGSGAQTMVSQYGLLVSPFGIAVEADGSILVTEVYRDRIIRVDPGTGTQTNLTGDFVIRDAYDVTVAPNGDIYVVELSTGLLKRVNPGTGAATVVSSGAYLGRTYSLAADADGNIITSNFRYRQVARTDSADGTQDLLTSGGNLSRPLGVAVDVQFSLDVITYAYVTLTNPQEWANEVLAADTTGTNISASYDANTGILSLTGDDTAANYQSVLRTVTYDNAAQPPTGGIRLINFVASDGIDESLVAVTSLRVNNPPTANAGGPYLVEVNGTVMVDGSQSSDPNGDTLTYAWAAEAGSFDGATLESPSYSAPSAAGIYELTLTVTDPYGLTDSDTVMMVVYDPEGGFVTGGGWIWSLPGAYVADDTLEGKANFGFVSKYKKGATTPTGQTEFQFKAGDLNFHSSSYEWLVIAGANAKYKGVGTINGGGDYGFMLTATDSDINGGGPVDTFRIKIWDTLGTVDESDDVVVYDNKMGTGDDAYDGTDLGGGNIKIHKPK